MVYYNLGTAREVNLLRPSETARGSSSAKISREYIRFEARPQQILHLT